MTKGISILLIILVTFCCTTAFGQQQDISAQKKQEIDAFFAKQTKKKTSLDLPTIPIGVDTKTLDPETKKAYQAALKEHYLYRQSGYQHRRKVFDWQLFSSKVIFYIVIFLVLCGIYFSGVQFHHSLKETGTEAEKEITQISASAEGITISSPVLGVIILTLSLAFFYLYMVYVYPIEEIF